MARSRLVSRGEADLVEGLVGPGLDVPVVADRVEVSLVDLAGLDRPDRGEDAVDAEQVGDRRLLPQRERLWQVADLTRGVDVAGRRGELAGDEAEQGGLAGAVATDQTGAVGAEGAVDPFERDGAVGPLEGQVAQGDGRGGGHGCVLSSLPSSADWARRESGTCRQKRERAGEPHASTPEEGRTRVCVEK